MMIATAATTTNVMANNNNNYSNNVAKTLSTLTLKMSTYTQEAIESETVLPVKNRLEPHPTTLFLPSLTMMATKTISLLPSHLAMKKNGKNGEKIEDIPAPGRRLEASGYPVHYLLHLLFHVQRREVASIE